MNVSLWVKGGHPDLMPSCPLLARTFLIRRMSAIGGKADVGHQLVFCARPDQVAIADPLHAIAWTLDTVDVMIERKMTWPGSLDVPPSTVPNGRAVDVGYRSSRRYIAMSPF
jgi:hypothetical protein